MSITGIGYEGLTVDALISRLRIRGVTCLVDARLNAISRKRGFSKKGLSAALEDAGITYLHRPALGNQRDNRAGYAELTGSEAQGARDRFRTILESDLASPSLAELVGLCKKESVAVLCFEADERHCHREQIIERVQQLLERELVAP